MQPVHPLSLKFLVFPPSFCHLAFLTSHIAFPSLFLPRGPLSLCVPAHTDFDEMQRQKSILSFFQKPSSETPMSGVRHSVSGKTPCRPAGWQDSLQASALPEIAKDIFAEDVSVAETPSEKISCPCRRSGNIAMDEDDEHDNRVAQPFSNILHKFYRENKSANSVTENQIDSYSPSSCAASFTIDDGYINKDNGSSRHGSLKDHNLIMGVGEKSLNIEFDQDFPGPETPAMRPRVPRFKRIQENYHERHCVTNSILPEPNKRQKPLEDLLLKTKADEEVSGCCSSKFEWLDPCNIRDASGRCPTDPLYDNRTLYIPSNSLKKMSASQKQYWNVKCQYMDVVLFFKVGKFYELYELDAEIGHKELDWKMTVNGVGKCRQVGISEAGIDDAVQKLIARGYKVGRMEQVETAGQAKSRGANSVIERRLVLVSTPSTVTEVLGPDAVHLLALKEGELNSGSTSYGFAFLDYATLKFWVGSFTDDGSCTTLGALVMQVSPREILHEKSGLSLKTERALQKYSSAGPTTMQLTPIVPAADILDTSDVKRLIGSRGYFKGSISWSSVIEASMHHDQILCALSNLICHVSRLKLDDALFNGELLPYHLYKGCLRMDGQTLVNLEIFCNNLDGGPSGTLYKHLDHCITSGGKRLLRRWICHPLIVVDDINGRLDFVEELVNHPEVISVMSHYLCKLPDLDRLVGRIKAYAGSSHTLLVPLIGEKLLKQRIRTFCMLIKGLRVGLDFLILLQKEGKLFSLSRVVNLPLLTALDGLLDQFEAAISDNFPYYQDHDRKDSDAEKLSDLVELFIRKVAEWSQVIHALNSIDVLQSFAATAISSPGSMSRPHFRPAISLNSSNRGNKGPTLLVKGLWHPYAVGHNENGQVPNDVNLGEDTSEKYSCALLLTGPNMGGKSTLLRATCLAVILAQLGCYVPCEHCMLSPADVIFTRLGATDRIMSGESTFYVECSETASILQNTTPDSLVLLDELGRGTSTFDGYAIAYAVLRHLVENVGCRLVFATHYNPLTKEFASHPRVNMQHMACTFNQGINSEPELVFLYRLASGSCPESYGLQVASLAGIPRSVIEAASTAGKQMKTMISNNFKSSEERSQFSTLHEEWLRTILAISRAGREQWDEDASDTLLCLWHEMGSFHRPNSLKIKA
ncbi:DNA mismatch repair protein MSH7 [Apostasia shenzhenica]|uniref:DNA mismatch repair protein MSH7 n=1 Tax=Apostasia shenzhenica TaxID=1088818 RepID=A0A2I0B6L6_9ASPA|nr:DNA mismatch repair protein MSH7 [Apostasia shenzhenica]